MVRLKTLVPSLKRRFQKLLGPRVEMIWISNAELDSLNGKLVWIEDVVFDMAIRARNAMPFGGRLVIESANIRIDEATADLQAGRYVMFEMTCLRRDPSELGAGEIVDELPTFNDEVLHHDRGHSEKLISSIGGQICEYNEPGRALTIRAFFPSVPEFSSSMREFVVNDESKEIRILLVEDEGFVRDVACEILESEGYEVLTARTGKEAIEIFRSRGPIHLLLTDVVMPGMNGRDLAEQLTSLSPELKTIYMSGYTDAYGVQPIQDMQLSFIQKPFTLESLTLKVKQILSPAES